MTEPGGAQSVACVAALRGCIDSFEDHLHPAWRERWAGLLGSMSRTGEPEGHRLRLQCFRWACGALPLPSELSTRLGAWSVLPAAALRQRLAALGLACRPGVLRRVLRRETLAQFEEVLGPAWPELRHATAGLAALAPAALALSVEAWPAIGYADLCSRRAWPARSVRRWVRLALPPTLPARLRVAAEPVAGAIEQVDEWFGMAAPAAMDAS